MGDDQGRNGWRGRPPLHSAASPAARRTLFIAIITVVMSAVGIVALLIPQGDRDAPPVDEGLALPTVPDPAGQFSPAPASIAIPSSATRTTAAATTASTTRPATTRPTPPATRTTNPPPVAALTPGATVGLEPRDKPGFRVRHRNFLGRVDRLSASSRADARFVVHAGLSRSSCVSFEAVNFPGRFLRHRDFVIRLDQQDGTALFRDDATFCPARSGDAVLLKSLNFPDRGVALHSDDTLHLDKTGVTAFVVRPPA